MLIRASGLHKIMGNAKSIDETLLTDDIRVIQKKKVKTDEEKFILEDLLNRTLSQGAKTYIKELVKFERYGFREYLDNKYIKKGLQCEDAAIDFLSELHDTFYIKHVGRVQNEFLTGECDILTDTMIRDIKCSWSIGTFPMFNDDAEQAIKDAGYDWQGRAYMWLYDRPSFSVDYVLMPTPEELLYFDKPEMMIDAVLDMPPHHRVKTVTINRDLELESLIKIKCELAQSYARELIKQLSN
ncbi:MAG TPA: hypothetical protein VIH30_11180 [Aquirhabdus sp.]